MKKKSIADFKLFREMLAAERDSDEVIVRYLRNSAEMISAFLGADESASPIMRERLMNFLADHWVLTHQILLLCGDPLVEKIEERMDYHRAKFAHLGTAQ